MSFIITLQDHEGSEEYNAQVSEEDYNKITSGDYELANKYLQREIERKNRLLAYQLLLKKPDVNVIAKETSNIVQSTSESMNVLEAKNLTNGYTTNMSDHESEQNDTNLSQRWSDKETKQLIELYRENFEKLHDRKYKAKLIYIYIAIAKHFDRFNSDQIESKIKNLKKTYKVILDNSKKTGRGRITWPYFDSMQEILGNKPENNPLNIASNRAGFEQNSSENSLVNSDSDCETPLPKKAKYNTEGRIEAGPSGLNDSNNNPTKRQSTRKTQNSEPEWIKEFRTELAQHHRERLEKQQQFLDLFKEWISKSKE